MVSKAREYLSVPYRHCGRDRNSVDCAGLILCAYKDAGVELPPVPTYGRMVKPDFLLKMMNNRFKLIGGINNAELGDVIVLRFSHQPQHLAIFTGNAIIHSYEKVGKVVEHRLADVWIKRIVGVYRYVR